MYTIEQIKTMLDKITPGQWTTGVAWSSFFVETGFDGSAQRRKEPNLIIEGAKRYDAEFIAAAPAIVDQLLRMVETRESYYKQEESAHVADVTEIRADLERQERTIQRLKEQIERLQPHAPMSERLNRGLTEGWPGEVGGLE